MAEPRPLNVRVQWAINPATVPVLVNQFSFQGGPTRGGISDGVYVTFGHVTPPIYPQEAPDEEYQVAPEQVLPVIPVGSFYMSVGTLRDLQRAIDETVASLDAESPE